MRPAFDIVSKHLCLPLICCSSLKSYVVTITAATVVGVIGGDGGRYYVVGIEKERGQQQGGRDIGDAVSWPFLPIGLAGCPPWFRAAHVTT